MPPMNKMGHKATSVFADPVTKLYTVAYYDDTLLTWDHKQVTLYRPASGLTYTACCRMNQASNQFQLGFKLTKIRQSYHVITPSGDLMDFTQAAQVTFLRPLVKNKNKS